VDGGKEMSRHSTAYGFFAFCVALMVTALACSHRDRVHDADAFATSREGRGPILIDGEAGFADGVDLEAVFFDYDRAVLKPDGKRVLRQHADWLRKHPKTQVQIEGSCDDRGSEEYNMKLGQRRAMAAKAYLIELGIAPERISVVSHGRLPGSQARVRAKNRRGQFVVYYSE
jgi:peptidoglycan-associated lipoprotein